MIFLLGGKIRPIICTSLISPSSWSRTNTKWKPPCSITAWKYMPLVRVWLNWLGFEAFPSSATASKLFHFHPIRDGKPERPSVERPTKIKTDGERFDPSNAKWTDRENRRDQKNESNVVRHILVSPSLPFFDRGEPLLFEVCSYPFPFNHNLVKSTIEPCSFF